MTHQLKYTRQLNLTAKAVVKRVDLVFLVIKEHFNFRRSNKHRDNAKLHYPLMFCLELR